MYKGFRGSMAQVTPSFVVYTDSHPKGHLRVPVPSTGYIYIYMIVYECAPDLPLDVVHCYSSSSKHGVAVSLFTS